jgi:molybdopterin synthase catalytic subunit
MKMHKDVSFTAEPIDEERLVRQRNASKHMGAAISFLGLVRLHEGEGEISAIDYEAFEKMARHQFDLIFQQVESRWPVESVRLVHRVGSVAVGEPSVWIEVVAPHRAEAFAACQFVIDEMKKVVPIWKKPIKAA